MPIAQPITVGVVEAEREIRRRDERQRQEEERADEHADAHDEDDLHEESGDETSPAGADRTQQRERARPSAG